jgi:hypothetical protein
VADLADFVIMQLVDLPDAQRAECIVRLLAQYKHDLAERFPGCEEEQKRFLSLFYALLRRRWNALGTTEDGMWGEAA